MQRNQTIELTGRGLLATIFVLSGLGKIGHYGATEAYMAAAGVPGQLLPLVILLEIAGGLAVAVGLYTRLTARVLAAFTLLAGVLFHHAFGDQIQLILFLKNLAIAGGLLLLAVHGPGAWSLDARRRQGVVA